MYTHQCLNVSWNNSQSEYFSTTNGVKQGGVLSPVLFSVYIDELLTRLKHSGYGAIQVLRNAIFREIGPPPTPS